MIVFCQAPADIPYVLSLYEQHNMKERISIFVINVENVYKFIKSLDLNLDQLVFIPYSLKSFKSPFDILEEKKRIKNIKKQYFNNIIGVNVYFFSRFEDWLTSSFLKTLSRKNDIYYIDHYDFSSKLFSKKRLSFNTLSYKIVLFFLTGINFKVEIVEKIPEFNYAKYNIKKRIAEIDKVVFENYSYEIDKIQNSRPTVLFFVMPCEPVIYECKSHDDMHVSIIKSFKKYGWNVIVKGHPRLGVPNNIMNMVDLEIPAYIPAEFLRLKDIKMCLGIITSALAYFAKNTDIKTYSLSNLFQFKNSESSKIYKNYLLELSNNEIIFFESYNDFENNIKKINIQ